MSNTLKLCLLALGVAGAWFAATRDSETPQSAGALRARAEREAEVEPQGALEPLNAATQPVSELTR